MVYGLWQSASGLRTQDFRQTVIANNMANIDTPGFKPDSVAFAERLSEAQRRGGFAGDRILGRMTGGVVETNVHTDFAPGPIAPTGNPLDVAILNGGFLSVQTPEGVRYTRDGRMTRSPNGMLVHVATGYPVLSDQGREILLDPNSNETPDIGPRGLIRQGGADIGRLGVVDFADRRTLNKTGTNLYEAGAEPIPQADATLQSGSIEGSAVDPVKTLVEMIAASRAYELNANLITMQDQSLGRVINDVGRVA